VIVRPGLTEEQLETAACKLVDFGNACWTHKQFTDDVQTRQYRWMGEGDEDGWMDGSLRVGGEVWQAPCVWEGGACVHKPLASCVIWG
jgi:hypothetical protein